MYKYVYNKPGRNQDDDEDEVEIKFPFGDIDKKPYRQFDTSFSAHHTHFYLSKSVGEADGYVDMIHRISTAGPADTIFIHLNTPGGHIDTGVQIINAMQNSQAKVVTILEATAYSLGTLIFLAGDEMVVNDHCMMMFHNFNGGLVGKGNELVSELEATVSWFRSLAQDIYIPFLSQEEFERIARGEDMWMQTPEIRKRLEHMVAEMQKKADAAAAEETATEDKQLEAALTKALAEIGVEVTEDEPVEEKPKRKPRRPRQPSSAKKK